MKKITLIAIAALSIFAASCQKETLDNTKKNSGTVFPKHLELTAGLEDSKTGFTATAGQVRWLADDFLFVFDEDGQKVKFKNSTATAGVSVVFATDSWTTKTPTYAVSAHADTAATACASGIITTNIAKEQTIMWTGNFAKKAYACVGEVTEDAGKFSITSMKNVNGLLKLSISDTTKTAAIIVESLDGEPICGRIDVDYAKLAAGNADFWTKTSESKDSIIVRPTSTAKTSIGTFKKGSYYICLLPRTYTNGLKITLVNTKGEVAGTRTIGTTSGITVERSKITETTGYVDVALPATFTLALDFYNEDNINPLGFNIPGTSAENSSTGETYYFNYHYTNMGQADSLAIPFVVCRGTAAGGEYKYFPATSLVYGIQGRYILNFVKKMAWIQLPAIPGRYLKSVEFSHGNNYAKRIGLKVNKGDSSSFAIGGSGATASSSALCTQTLVIPADKLAKNQSYYLVSLDDALRLYSLKLTYSSTKD